MYKAIKSFYSSCTACIRVNEYCTDWFPVNSGVRQGDNISPTLFSLYINELAKEINSLKSGVKLGALELSILLYADDMVLVSENEQDLQKMLETMHDWCSKWRLKVNTTKTNIVHFRPKRAQETKFVFKLGETILEKAKEYKYLGVILDEHLTFNSCSKVLAESGGRALGAVISKFKTFKDLGYSVYSKMYNTCVIPIVDYGSGVWGKAKVSHSDLIQNKAYRYFLGVHKFTAISAMQAEMGWLSPKYRKHINMLRLWNRLIKLPNDRLTKRVFTYIFDTETPSWCSDLKEILTELNLLSTYLNKEVCDIDECTKSLTCTSERDCLSIIRIKPKLRSFKLFKTDCSVTDYVKGCLNRQDRSILAKFRCGILQLKIETGRFIGLKPEERICEFCDLQVTEDELHFLCVCDYYSDLRTTLYKNVADKFPIFTTFDTQEKFVFLLTNCNFYVGKFIKFAWDRRKKTLYK